MFTNYLAIRRVKHKSGGKVSSPETLDKKFLRLFHAGQTLWKLHYTHVVGQWPGANEIQMSK